MTTITHPLNQWAVTLTALFTLAASHSLQADWQTVLDYQHGQFAEGWTMAADAAGTKISP